MKTPNDYPKKIIDFCNIFAVEEVRKLMISIQEHPNSLLLSSLNWQRLVNFAITNRICEFDSNRIPSKISPSSKVTPIAELLKLVVQSDSQIDTIFSFPEDRKNKFQHLIQDEIDQPFEECRSGFKIKQDWLYLFEEHDPNSIYHWLQNFFKVSIRFFSQTILENAILTGNSQWRNVFGERVSAMFDLSNFDPNLFQSVMKAMHQANSKEVESILPLISLTKNDSVLDLGGATGAISRSLVVSYPSLKVDIYEKNESLPIIKDICVYLKLPNPENLQYISGDFFSGNKEMGLLSIPPDRKYELIVLGWILHDWQDPEAIEILLRASHHLAINGKILLLEKPLEIDGTGAATNLDITMLLQTGGKERTLYSYAHLAKLSNLILDAHIPTSNRRDLIFLRKI